MMKVKDVPIRSNFPPHFCEALGRFAIAFGRVEYEIKLAVKTLSGKDFFAGMAEAESSGVFRNLCEKTKILARDKLMTCPQLLGHRSSSFTPTR
jgi:hypothetical protein